MIQLLTVTQEPASWIMSAIRSAFWLLAKGFLILLDGAFLVIDDIWRFKFFDNEYVTKIYQAAIIVASTWLILKVFIEIIMHFFVNQDENSSPTRIFKGIIFSIVMMFLIPPIFSWGYDLSSNMTQYVVSVSSNDTTNSSSFESSMSSMIMTAFANDNQMEEEDKEYFIENWFTANYNEVVNDGLLDSGQYKYSFNTFPIFIVSLLVFVLMIFIGIQVAKRVIELALYKAIAPFVCTSLISLKTNTFEFWCKGVLGTFLVTTVQYLCIGILFNVFGSVVKDTNYTMSVIIIVIGALLFIISSPQLVSALLNTNTGAMSNMNELHSFTALGTSLLALSKYSNASDSSSTKQETNSTSNTDNSSNSENNDSINMNTTSSNFDNNQNSNISSDKYSANSMNNSSSSNNMNTSNYDNDFSNSGLTSLADRIDIYKGMTDNSSSFGEESSSLSQMSAENGEMVGI